MPLTGAPTTELRGVHAPFLSPVFFPMRLASVELLRRARRRHGGTNLLVTPAQHRAANVDAGTSTLRSYTDLDLRLFYSGNLTSAALSDAPSIVSVDARPSMPAASTSPRRSSATRQPAIHQVWVTYTGTGAGAWQPLDLAQCVAPASRLRHRRGLAAVAGPARVAAGQPAVLRAGGQRPRARLARRQPAASYYRLAGAAQTATTLTLASPPTPGTFGDSPTVTAALTATAGGAPVAGKTVTIAIGGSAAVGTTGADGRVTRPGAS